MTLRFERSNSDDFDTITFTEIEDYTGQPNATLTDGSEAFDGAEGLILDFADDITAIYTDGTATSAASVNYASSQHGAVIVYGSGTGSTQQGFIYDHDGDGQLSDGDTLVDMTTALSQTATSTAITLAGGTVGIHVVAGDVVVESAGGDIWTFTLSVGDLIDIV